MAIAKTLMLFYVILNQCRESHRRVTGETDSFTSEKAIDFLGRRKCGVVGQSVFCRGSCV